MTRDEAIQIWASLNTLRKTLSDAQRSASEQIAALAPQITDESSVSELQTFLAIFQEDMDAAWADRVAPIHEKADERSGQFHDPEPFRGNNPLY